MNLVFRVYKYAIDYATFSGKTLTLGDFVEIYPVSVKNEKMQQVAQVYPNPFSNKIIPANSTGNENFELRNQMGQLLWLGMHIEKQDFSALPSGVYFLKVNVSNSVLSIKLRIKQ